MPEPTIVPQSAAHATTTSEHAHSLIPCVPDLRALVDAYFAAVSAELDTESQQAALEGEFAPEVTE